MTRLAILLSGRGSNFLAIHEAIARGDLAAEIVVVISNRADAPGAQKARELGYETECFSHRDYESREAHEALVIDAIEVASADFIVLAGYMRLLSESFVERFPLKILNIHPSLLPSFPGVDAQKQAFDHGAKVSGCTVHFVDAGLDSGPIIHQRAVDISDCATAVEVASRILGEEHRVYVEAIRNLSESEYRIEGRRVVFR